MEDITVDLAEVAGSDTNGSYHARDDKGKRFPQLLIDDGIKTQVKGKLVTAIHGKLKPGGDPASLLIFEFSLTASNGRRFETATISLTFEDGNGPSATDPEVYDLAPSGLYTLNKETDTKDVAHAIDAALNVNPVPALGINLGYHWTMSKKAQKTHSATLNGMSRRFKSWGEETTAMWVMEEDPVKGEGIPTFLRTAVTLRHDPDECREFRFSLEIDATEKKHFFRGASKPSKMLKPINLDPRILAAGKMEGVEANNLGALSLDSEYIVRLAKALTV